MGAKLLQPTLTAGEVSPSLFGRVDIARYGTGLKQCRNFLVRPYGGIENRPGFEYKDGAVEPNRRRLIPFTYSEEVSYVLWFGDEFVRIYTADGDAVAPDAPAYAGGTTYALGAYVTSAGIVYRSLQASNTGHTPASSPTWWTADPGLQIVSPYAIEDIYDVRFTQSADVLYLAHPDYQQRVLRRTAANVFAFGLFEAKDGPFQDINIDESVTVAATGVLGTVTIEANADIFTADMVGTLFYLETKNLGQVKPWVVADRSVAVGSIRRSDGKTYICTDVPSGGAWAETGPRTPIHENGRVWDGAGDSRSNGVDTYTVGVEWEYVDAGYGIVELTAYVSPTQMTARVTKRLPAFVVGGVGSPAHTWTFSGTDSVGPYALAAAGNGIYTVTIDGGPVQSDPNYTPGSGAGGGVITACVGVECFLPGHDGPAASVVAGDVLVVFDPATGEEGTGEVDYAATSEMPMYRIVTARGACLPCSDSAPIPVRGGGYKTPTELMGQMVPITRGDGVVVWDVVVDIVGLGVGLVRHITMKGPVRVFWAGEPGTGWYIAHHNMKRNDVDDPSPF